MLSASNAYDSKVNMFNKNNLSNLNNSMSYHGNKRNLIDHFTVVCSATWPVDGSEARVDLVLIQTSLLLSCKCTLLKSEQLVLHNKRSEVCIKTRSTLASLPSKGQVTKQTTVKWSIGIPRFIQVEMIGALNGPKSA